MKLTRSYTEHETPQVGDVLQLFEGPFGAGVITSVGPNSGMVLVTVERVHASCSEHCPQIQIGLERVTLSMNRARETPVFVTGPSGRIDNRKR